MLAEYTWPNSAKSSRCHQLHPTWTLSSSARSGRVCTELCHYSPPICVKCASIDRLGKTRVFRMRTLHVTGAGAPGDGPRLLPGQGLANDQLSGAEAALAAGMGPDSVEQITGDTPMRHREQLLQKATVALVPPDVVHAWLIRTGRGPAQRRFLANLRAAVTGEVHVYEDILGSNAALMFHRLDAATLRVGNRYFVQYIAATATIRFLEKHM